jgi:hypothetical protein
MHEQRLLVPDDDHCDRREFWHIHGPLRTLLTVDCTEQWGADSQGPVQFAFSGENLQIAYLEWQSSDSCEKSIVILDWETAKILSARRWSGDSRIQRLECVRLKPLKAAPSIGKGTIDSPLLMFH